MAYGVYVPVRQGEQFLLICQIQEDELVAWALADQRRGARVIWGTKETMLAKLPRPHVERMACRPRPEAPPARDANAASP